MSPYRDSSCDFTRLDGGKVLMGNDVACQLESIGSIKFKLSNGTTKFLYVVRFVPGLKRNLISIGMLEKLGYEFKAKHGVLTVTKGVIVVMRGLWQNGLYVLEGKSCIHPNAFHVQANTNKTRLWHVRLDHISESGLMELHKQGPFGKDQISKLEFCEHCVLGKQTRVKFQKALHRTKGTLDYVHSDVWGTSKTSTHGGFGIYNIYA